MTWTITLFSGLVGGALALFVMYLGYTTAESWFQFALFVTIALLMGDVLRRLTERTARANLDAAQRGESA